MKRFFKVPMVFKVWLAVWILILFIVGLMWVFQVWLLEESYLTMKTERLERSAKQVQEWIDQRGYSPSLHTELDEMAAAESLHIMVMNESGEILYTSIARELRFFRTSTTLYLSPSRRLMSEGDPFMVALGGDPHLPRGAFLVHGIPLSHTPQGWMYILLTEPLQQMGETTRVIERQIFWISLLSILFGSLLALIFARFFSRRIVQLKHATQKIAQGDFQIHIPPGPSDEMGELIDSINEMAQQLEKIHVFREELITNTSHDLKTPINTILAYAEIMQEFQDDPTSEMKDHLRIIIHEARVLGQRVDKILELSRMESGGYRLNLESISLNELIHQVIDSFKTFAFNKGIAFAIDVDPSLTIQGDHHWLHRALSNLVDNAVKFSKASSTITIEAKHSEEGIRFSISDQGIGIPEDALKHVWDRFYKVDRSRSGAEENPGLGMSIVKAIFEAHGYRYGIESHPGIGTTVWWTIPKE